MAENPPETYWPLTSNAGLAQRIQEELNQNIYLCYQCVKCTSGCTLAEFMDWQPNQVMRALQLEQEDIALSSQTPWLCASCQTCTTRCPQELDITTIMEFLTREALQRGIKPAIPEVNIFNEAFLREVRLWGRSYELGLMAEMKLRTRDFTSDLDLGVRIIRKGKMPFLPKRGHPSRKPRPVPGAIQSVAYYPGCSLHSTAPEYDTSARAVCEALDLHLVEPHGWVCCGSTPAHRADPEMALRLPLKNLAMIEQMGFQEVTMPCAACFNHHKMLLYELHKDDRLISSSEMSIGYAYRDSVQVNTLVETIIKHTGIEVIASKVRKPLKGLRVVCYYGCLLTRPPQVTGSQHPENPTDMDGLLVALGAEVVDWSYKTVCCGATHSLTRPDIVLKLSGGLIDHARRAGATAIAVACPLCHTNLDARQSQMKLEKPMPVLYFTQLMALALGLPEKEAALHKNIIDPRPVLRELELVAAE